MDIFSLLHWNVECCQLHICGWPSDDVLIFKFRNRVQEIYTQVIEFSTGTEVASDE